MTALEYAAITIPSLMLLAAIAKRRDERKQQVVECECCPVPLPRREVVPLNEAIARGFAAELTDEKLAHWTKEWSS